MTTELSKKRLTEIEIEAEELYPVLNQSMYRSDKSEQHIAYVEAATKYALLLEQERDKVKGLVEAIEFVINSPHPEYCKTKLETALNKYKSI